MGAGKSTIGRLLSQSLGRSFVDVDREVEARAGADIPWIFDVEGEQGFRQRESAVITELVQSDNLVIATGGGAVISRDNRMQMQRRGFVIYLKASIAQQLERTAKDKNRPLLQAEKPRDVLEKLMQDREPLYQQLCDMVAETDQQHPRSVVADIVEHLKEQGIAANQEHFIAISNGRSG